MMISKKTVAMLVTCLVAIQLSFVASQSPFIIADDRVRSLDISPVLGRGYSIMTNTYQSTCLVVEETTVPSYNYDYFFTDFTKSTDSEKEMSGKISASLSFFFVSAEVSASASSSSKSSTKTRIVTATMKIERYYASVREEVSPLANDAFTLLETQDYVGFFKACGPNYVRSIRRAQEVTAIFSFKTTNKETAKQFSSSIKVKTIFGKSKEKSKFSKSKFSSANTSLVIKIQGFGMGLNQEGSETLVAQSMSEYNDVMKFSFMSMTQNEDANHIGMVYGIEVVPWVNNVAFQVAAKVAEENIIIPLPRSLIPRAVLKDPSSSSTWSTANRDLFKCEGVGLTTDRYGYCCEPEQLYNHTAATYPEPAETCDPDECVCKPVQNLDKALVKDNMANNGEFVARLDNAMRYKLAQLASLEKCISAMRAIPKKYEYNILKSNDSVKYDKEISFSVSLMELKKAIDPLDDFGMVTQLGNELDEWIMMFYTPCLRALYGMNVGTSPNTDVSLFSAYPWYSHPECMMLSCITNGMRWDRKTGEGCVTSMIVGRGAEDYGSGTDANNEYCATRVDTYGATQECRYKSSELHTYHDAATECWENTQSISGLDYLINHFCNPVLTTEVLDSTTQGELKQSITDHCT